MLFRFVAALGIGGEWAVGASLLAETWPRSWRPWIAAVLQTGVNVGILFAAAVVHGLASLPFHIPERYVFLIGVLPALMVFWIRRRVPEPETWTQAEHATVKPRVSDLFRGALASITARTTAVCALSLSAWWLFVFWHSQHLRQLLGAEGLPRDLVTQKITAAFFCMIAVSIAGNFIAGALAQRLGNRLAITLMLAALCASMVGAYGVPRDFASLAWFWIPLVGLFSGVFGLFTMYLPPLFPTLLRTTGAGFTYNIGRIAAAVASIVFGWLAPVNDFRLALLAASALAGLSALLALFLPAKGAEE